MIPTPPPLPTDLEVRMMLIHQEHLTQQNDQIRQLLQLHEQELALLWACLIGVTLYLAYREHKG